MATKDQIRAGLGLLNITGKDLASAIGVSANTVNRFLRERDASTSYANIQKMEKILEERGVEFLEADGVRRKDDR
ncbi:MAG: helix-turn-helix domain-containing protein [Geminicoccaceae bacterium]